MPTGTGQAFIAFAYQLSDDGKYAIVEFAARNRGPRGAVTQVRTFQYDSAGRMTQATNPENGTVAYTYNGDNTVATKTDAKGQYATYTYDSYRRLIRVQHFTDSQAQVELPCERVEYSWDTNPYASYDNTWGRVAATRWNYREGGSCPGGVFYEMFNYTTAGQVTLKTFRVNRTYARYWQSNLNDSVTQGVPYSGIFGPNSNSFAGYLGQIGGFSPPKPPGAWQWGYWLH